MQISSLLLTLLSVAAALKHSNSNEQNPLLSMASQAPIAQPPGTVLYFGYGSNLWLHQMAVRCPTSTYLGVARLPGYKWIIYSRGYANIVQTSNARSESHADIAPHWDDTKHENEVYALVYSLTPSDEARLDRNEGVPIAYQKELLNVELWPADASNPLARVNVTNSDAKKEVEALVYINRLKEGKTEGEIKHEYIYRMNMGINDALSRGVPEGYVKRVLRRWVSEKEDKALEEVARRQALEFKDER